MIRRLLVVMVAVLASAPLSAQMPNPRDMSGRPLPSPDVAPGSLQVRVVKESFANNVAGQAVEVIVDGQSRTVTTGDDGRALVSGLRVGNNVRLVTVVDGERIESQTIPIGTTGLMVALVAGVGGGAPAGGMPPAAPAAPVESGTPAVPGTVVLGPESRVIVELAENGLLIFYVLEIVNSLATPVDIGGPLIVDLPTEARGAGLLRESTPQATVNGPRVIVTGPFAPGSTVAQVAYELPYRGATARLEQVWPAALQQVTLIVERHGDLDIQSAQIAAKNEMTNEGQPLYFASGPALQAGQTLTVDFSGLPHHPTWPQWLAISLTLGLIAWGVWGAATAPRRA